MKVVIVKPCAFWGPQTGRIQFEPGDLAVELGDEHVHVALAEGWAEPYQSADDLETNAPPREKAANRRAPERK